MARSKRGTIKTKKRERLLKLTKGYRWGRKSKYIAGKIALTHALKRSYIDRKRKKRDFRKLWETQINAKVKSLGSNYSKFIYGLKKEKIEVNRKILSQLAINQPKIFEAIFKEIKK